LCYLVKRIQPDSEAVQDVIEDPDPQESQVLKALLFSCIKLCFFRKIHFECWPRSFHVLVFVVVC